MTAHDPKRRAALVRALIGIVAESGLDAVSVREVAGRAGVSIGAVQHHFPTKSAMLRAAMDDVVRRWTADVERETSPDDPAAALRYIVHRLLPESPDDADAKVWLAFVARAAVDGDLARMHREGTAELEDALVGGALDRTSRERSDVADRMAMVLALADGLAVAVLLEPERMPVDRARAIVDTTLDRLFAE